VGGSWAEKEQEQLLKIVENGHEIGNHGYFHKDQNKLDYDGNYMEINSTHTLIKTLVDIDMNLFAPPSGAYNNSTLQSASDLGYKTIMWSKDTIDWRDKDEDLIYLRATKNVSGGDLILMHPTECTLKALPKILDYYLTNDLVATKVSKTLG
jgi:peptidoglycan/xylan/chitin deacetylase (PgdA/CDA1 family)